MLKSYALVLAMLDLTGEPVAGIQIGHGAYPSLIACMQDAATVADTNYVVFGDYDFQPACVPVDHDGHATGEPAIYFSGDRM